MAPTTDRSRPAWTLMLIVVVALVAVAVVAVLGFAWTDRELLLAGLVTIGLLALVPEVVDLLLGHLLRPQSGPDAPGNGSAPTAGTAPATGAAKNDGGARFSPGLTRGTIALVALAIFAVALFSMLEFAHSSCKASAVATTSPSTAPSPSPASSAAPSASSDVCATTNQATSTLLGALVTLVAAASAFYFGSRTAETAAASAAAGPAAAGPAAASASSQTPPQAPSPTRDRPAVQLDDPVEDAGLLILRGKVTPQGDTTHYRFEVGPTLDYGDELPVRELAGDAGERNVYSDPIVAAATSPFHYRLVAWNDLGISATGDRMWPSTT